MTKESEPLPDPESRPQPPEPERAAGSKVHLTRTAEIIDTASEMGFRVARLTPQQILSVIAVGILAFICSMQAFQSWTDREDRRDQTRERQEVAAAAIREHNAQSELVRNHCREESTSMRVFFSQESDKRMRFEAEERSKDRAMLTNISMRITDMERALKDLDRLIKVPRLGP